MTRFVAWVWLGIVVGVSFMATPIKFTADSLSRPVALDVGRATFQLLNRTEWVFAVILVALIWRASQRAEVPRLVVGLVGLVIALLVLQTVWLLPELNARVAMIIDGVEPSSSLVHTIFGAFEVAKVTALGFIGHLARPMPQISVMSEELASTPAESLSVQSK